MLELRPAIVISNHEIDAVNHAGHSTVSLLAPAEQDITENESQMTESEDELLSRSLRQRFHEQYDGKVDAKIGLQIVQRSKKINEDDF